eukprot:TRINITY_DN6326_c1_g1_i1.p1 TRINITY_DN6326_c1_g1~~TRINITY_DN6326_c1_g1_i1.p1  ORF type:complete len:484 (+),score=101.50 TRINITY_DN6326_c1_g1_i1:52-1452(+)
MGDLQRQLSRAASNDPTLVELEITPSTRRAPSNRAELFQRVVTGLATNTHIKTLKLTGLDLTETDIAPLAELLRRHPFEELDFGYNNLTGEILLPALVERATLRVLTLRYNKTLKSMSHLSVLNSLRELFLSDCQFSAIPPGVLQMPHLEALKLNRNPLKTLPDSLASLVSLKTLNIICCDFYEFPAVLLKMPQLQWIDISDNCIATIPEGITALVNLKSLLIYRCGFSEFPLATTRLTQLGMLGISLNFNIKRVPDEVGSLRNLKEITLGNCGLTELPPVLWTLQNLETLSVGLNPLTSVPGGIGALSKLKRFKMNHCALDRLPREMQRLTELEVLNINDTQITHLPVWLASIASLTELNCTECPLVGVALADNTLFSFRELAAFVKDTSDPEELEKGAQSFKQMTRVQPLYLLELAKMYFAPRTPLRALSMSKCLVYLNRVDLGRLPAHIRDEVVHGPGVAQQR